VALECQQVEGEDFIEIYSPIVQADSLRLIVAIASKYDWKLKQLDIKASYLDLEEDIYTKIPFGDKNINTNKLWLIKKALYSLKQVGRM